MKRFLAFVFVLITIIILGYLQPIYFPVKKTEIAKVDTEQQSNFQQALPYEKLPTTGYADYIGKNSSFLINQLGMPSAKITANYNYECWQFNRSNGEYIEANVKDGKIAAIKVLNKTQETTPFHLGMTLSEVSHKITIYSNFNFSYNKKQYNLELTEEDMNYRPLIAFNNDTFAILFFGQGNKKLIGIIYLDKESLLTMLPYQLNKGQQLLPNKQQSGNYSKKQLIQVINRLRKAEKLPVYTENRDNQKQAELFIEEFNEKKTLFLSDERLRKLSEIQNSPFVNLNFSLSSEEVKQWLTIENMNQNNRTIIYQEPIYDPVFTLLSWFSDPLDYSKFNHKQKEMLSVALDNHSMLILIHRNIDEKSLNKGK